MIRLTFQNQLDNNNNSSINLLYLIQQVIKFLVKLKSSKQPATVGLKKTTAAANAEYTFVVDKNTTQRNDITLPSSSLAQPSAQHKAELDYFTNTGKCS